jgi:superfamily I DNA and/or RNA helicase
MAFVSLRRSRLNHHTEKQIHRYRAAMAKASENSFWKGRDIWKVQLMTVDSFQGEERPCVILYVLSLVVFDSKILLT